jgi:hypothetical protein
VLSKLPRLANNRPIKHVKQPMRVSVKPIRTALGKLPMRVKPIKLARLPSRANVKPISKALGSDKRINGAPAALADVPGGVVRLVWTLLNSRPQGESWG